MAYPQTSVNTIATAPEMMKMQLRVYLGAYLKNPANVMVIPDCHFEGILEGGDVTYQGKAEKANNFWHFYGDGTMTGKATPYSRSLDFTLDDDGKSGDLSTCPFGFNQDRDFEKNMAETDPYQLLSDPSTRPAILYAGAVYADAVGTVQLEPNEGHLGCLDHPSGINKLFGINVFAPGAPSVHPH